MILERTFVILIIVLLVLIYYLLRELALIKYMKENNRRLEKQEYDLIKKEVIKKNGERKIKQRRNK
jgi:predicted Holliday junction resolvase-like endonuclease